jgi:kynureninase
MVVTDEGIFRFAGWWGHDTATRFKMPPAFSRIPGAQGFQQSNPDILSCASLFGSLQIFKEFGMPTIRKRSLHLTALLFDFLVQSKYFVPHDKIDEGYSGRPAFTIITPSDPESRGAQLSLLFLPVESPVMPKIFELLVSYGVVGDERHPSVIRLAPCPLYNHASDCQWAAESLNRAFDELCH